MENFVGEKSIHPFISTTLLVGTVGEFREKLAAPSVSLPTSEQVGCGC